MFSVAAGCCLSWPHACSSGRAAGKHSTGRRDRFDVADPPPTVVRSPRADATVAETKQLGVPRCRAAPLTAQLGVGEDVAAVVEAVEDADGPG